MVRRPSLNCLLILRAPFRLLPHRYSWSRYRGPLEIRSDLRADIQTAPHPGPLEVSAKSDENYLSNRKGRLAFTIIWRPFSRRSSLWMGRPAIGGGGVRKLTPRVMESPMEPWQCCRTAHKERENSRNWGCRQAMRRSLTYRVKITLWTMCFRTVINRRFHLETHTLPDII